MRALENGLFCCCPAFCLRSNAGGSHTDGRASGRLSREGVGGESGVSGAGAASAAR